MNKIIIFSLLLFAGLQSCSETTSPVEQKRAGVGSSFTFISTNYDEAGTVLDSMLTYDTIIASGLTHVGINDVTSSTLDGDTSYFKFLGGGLVYHYQDEITIPGTTVQFQGFWVLFDKVKDLDTVFENTQNTTIYGLPGSVSMTTAKRYVKDSTYTVPGTNETLNISIQEKLITIEIRMTGVGLVNTTTVNLRTFFCESLGYYVYQRQDMHSTSSQSPIPNGSVVIELRSYNKK